MSVIALWVTCLDSRITLSCEKDFTFSLQKKVLTKPKPGSSSNKDNGMEYPSCPSVLSDITIGNCLTPPSKRQKTDYDCESTTGSEQVYSPYKVNVIVFMPPYSSRKHLRMIVTPDFHLTYSENGGNLGSESK